MHVLWFAGLKGAVAYACAREFPNLFGHTQEFTAATMAIVLVTIIVMGGGTEPLLEHLQIPMNVDQKEYMKLWRTQHRLKGFFHDFGKHAATIPSMIIRCSILIMTYLFFLFLVLQKMNTYTRLQFERRRKRDR